MRFALMLALLAAACRPAPDDSTATTSHLADGTYQAFSARVLRDFGANPDNANITGAYFWDAYTVGDEHGRIRVAAVGSDLDGIARYQVQIVLHDPDQPDTVGATTIMALTAGPDQSAEDVLTPAVLAAIHDDLNAFSQQGTGSGLDQQSLRPQGVGSTILACQRDLVLTGISLLGLGFFGLSTVGCVGGDVVLSGSATAACVAMGVITVAEAAAVATAGDALYACVSSQPSS